MFRGKKALLILAVLLVLSSYAAAQSFLVDVTVDNPQVNPGEDEAARIMISVTNQGDEVETYRVNYQVSNPGWYFLPDYVLTVAPGETETSVLYAEPDEEAVEGSIGVIITVSADGEEVTRRPSYRIVRDRDIIITGIETDSAVYDPSSQVNVTLDIKNVRRRELSTNGYHAVFTLDDRRKTVSIPSLIDSEPETLETSFTLGQYDSGVKSVVARVESIEGELQDSRSANIRVRESEKLVTERTRDSRLLTSRRSIIVSNEGNTVSGATDVSAGIPVYLSYFTSLEPAPSSSRVSGGEKVYTWEISSLAPGESRSVGYVVNYWAPALLVILLLGSIGLAVMEYRKPHLVKRVYRKEGTHAVHVRVENRSGRSLENVVVRDFVPSICSLVKKFDASPPEKIREGGEVTELEWDLGRFEPGEERILVYSISSQVEVEGDVRLPPAHISYDSRGRRKMRHSHPARADFS